MTAIVTSLDVTTQCPGATDRNGTQRSIAGLWKETCHIDPRMPNHRHETRRPLRADVTCSVFGGFQTVERALGLADRRL